MKKPSAEKIERYVSKVRARVMKERRRADALAMEPMLLGGIAVFAFVIGLLLGGVLAWVIL